MKIMPFFKRSHAHTALSAPNPAARLYRPTPRHSRASLAQSLMGSLLLSPGSWCSQGLYEPSEHLWRLWGLILNVISPLLLSCWGFSFALGCGVSFFGGIQSCPVDGSVVACNFGVLTGEDECTAFHSAILWITYNNILLHIY